MTEVHPLRPTLGNLNATPGASGCNRAQYGRNATIITGVGARSEATDQVTFDLLDVRGRPQVCCLRFVDSGRSCELAESRDRSCHVQL